MSEEEKERDFIKTCFNIVAGLEVKNESQAIAKKAILDEVECLTKENKQLKEEINRISKKEVKVRDMLYSIENVTLTRKRLMQIEEVLFELEGNNE